MLPYPQAEVACSFALTESSWLCNTTLKNVLPLCAVSLSPDDTLRQLSVLALATGALLKRCVVMQQKSPES